MCVAILLVSMETFSLSIFIPTPLLSVNVQNFVDDRCTSVFHEDTLV